MISALLLAEDVVSPVTATSSGSAPPAAAVPKAKSPKSGQRYEDARDVYLDLKMLAENPNGPLGRSDGVELGGRGVGKLGFLSKGGASAGSRGKGEGGFYGRQVQMSMLLHLFQSTVSLGSQPLMATIVGYPGTG